MRKKVFLLIAHSERNWKHSWTTGFENICSTPSPKSLPVKTWKAFVLFVKAEWGFYPHILAMVSGYIIISICLSHLNKSKTAQYQLVLFTLWFSLTFGVFWWGCLSGASECFSKNLPLSNTKIKAIVSGKGKNLDSLIKKEVRAAWRECWII